MFRRILVATDGSARAKGAFEGACTLAHHSAAEIVLLTVLPVIASNDEFDRAHQMLGELGDEGRSEGVVGRALVAFGEPDEAINMVARDEKCDLIVAAAQPREGLAALIHPRLTPRLQARAAIPVLIWPEDIPADAIEGPLAHAGAPVLVPLDGSTYAEEALPLAASLAREFHRTLLLVRVVAPVVSPVTSADAAEVVGMELESDEHQAREYLAVTRRRIAATTGLAVEAMMRMGIPAHEFLHVAESHPGSLIVMTTYGRSGLERFFIGSVAGHVVRRAHVPVLIIPPRAVQEKAIPQIDQLAVDAVEH